MLRELLFQTNVARVHDDHQGAMYGLELPGGHTPSISQVHAPELQVDLTSDLGPHFR